jgi:hypothetical protein
MIDILLAVAGGITLAVGIIAIVAYAIGSYAEAKGQAEMYKEYYKEWRDRCFEEREEK